MSGPPSSIGRYCVRGVLGKGSMGVVYRAHDPAIGRDVAIKLVRIADDDAERHADALARFRSEVQAAARCSHPAVVAVFDFFEDNGDPAIVMELIEGGSLHRELRDPVRRSRLRVTDILLPALDALGHAHAMGIIHRDIKPANILITTAGTPKIADFGIARAADTSATQPGLMLGTPSYMAPEQVDNTGVDHRADLFSAGAILYEMLCGKAPFTGETVTRTVLRLTSTAPADMTPVVNAGGRAYVGVLERALAKDPSHRFQSAAEFAAALRTIDYPSTHDASNGNAREQDGAATVVFSPRSARAWDIAFLQQVEQHLARFVGPMARMAVLRAAAEAKTAEDLYATIARSLSNQADRSAFLRAAGAGRVEPALSPTLRPGTRALPVGPNLEDKRSLRAEPARPAETRRSIIDAATQPIPADAIAAAQAALVVYTGPIARILAREAAAHATSSRDFIERLCAHVSKADERAVFLQRLRRDVEPKLP